MTNTEAGLLDDIIEHPDDDTPRLIYADWLEDHGQEERAEFIRVQVELDWYPECNVLGIHCDECEKLKKPERYWFDVNRGQLLSTMPSPFGVSLWRQRKGLVLDPVALFRRGFIAEAHAPLDVLMEHLPQLVREHPIEAVRVTDREPHQFTTHAEWGRWPGYPGEDPKHTIPEDIWLMLQHATTTDVRQHWSLAYSTADAAHAALSVALLRRAKAHPLTRLEG